MAPSILRSVTALLVAIGMLAVSLHQAGLHRGLATDGLDHPHMHADVDGHGDLESPVEPAALAVVGHDVADHDHSPAILVARLSVSGPWPVARWHPRGMIAPQGPTYPRDRPPRA